MDEDPVERPAPDVPPPSTDEQQSEAAEPDATPAPPPPRVRLSWLRDISKANLIVGLLGLVLAAAALVIPLAQSGGDPSTPADGTTKSIPATGSAHSPEAKAPSPLLSGDASCKEFRDAAALGSGTRLPIDSPGQIGGGPAVRVRVLPDGRFVEVARASPGDELEVSAQLFNGDYSAADGVSVSASISSERGRCWRIIEGARAESFPGAHPRLGPVLILLKGGRSAKLGYVSGSTRLVDERGRTLDAELPDGLIHGWLRLPYAVPGGTSYFLSFRVRVRSGGAG